MHIPSLATASVALFSLPALCARLAFAAPQIPSFSPPGASPTPHASEPPGAAPTPEPPDAAPAPHASHPPVAAPTPHASHPPTDASEIEAALKADAHALEHPELTPSEPAQGGAFQSLNPDIGMMGSFAAALFSEEENHQTGHHDPTENGFNLQAVELAIGASVDPYLRFDAHFVFGPEGFELEEAFGTTLDLGSHLQARFGQFLSRFGRINASHPHSWQFVDQPLSMGRVFGGEGNRALGLELSYLTPLPWYVELVGSASRADGEGTARSFFGSESPRVRSPLDLLYIAALKQFFPLSSDWSLFFGLSGAFGPNASGGDNRSDVYGTDLYLTYRPVARQSFTQVSLQTEWLYRRRQVPRALITDTSGYAQVVYRFAQRWSAATRFEYGSPVVDRHGAIVVDPLDPSWLTGRTRFALALTHDPTEFSRFRLQGSRDTGFDEPMWSAFLAAELMIGPHPSHPY